MQDLRVPHCLVPVGVSLSTCDHFWLPYFKKDIEKLERVLEVSSEDDKDESKSSKESLKELCMLSLERGGD